MDTGHILWFRKFQWLIRSKCHIEVSLDCLLKKQMKKKQHETNRHRQRENELEKNK